MLKIDKTEMQLTIDDFIKSKRDELDCKNMTMFNDNIPKNIMKELDVLKKDIYSFARQSIKTYIFSGNATFTIESTSYKPSQRYTYKVTKQKREKEVYKIGVMYGTDNTKYRYVGTYYRQKKSIFIKDKERKNTLFIRALFNILEYDREIPYNCHFYQSNKCACCGRLLTTPESLARGYGPECYEHICKEVNLQINK